VAAEEEPTDEMDVGSGGRARSALAEAPLFAPGRQIGGRYLLERRIGHGGMAVVWLATDERLDRPVAIKVLSDTLTADHDYVGRFGREARLAAGLQHPNLVSVYDYDAGERPWLVMEYVEGGDLAALLSAGHAPAAEPLARELLAALRHIHAHGVLHRDIKPQNVLVDRYGHARLTDFGIARPRNAATLTRTGQVIGTERYLAPEVMRGQPASERSDLYALGVLLADAVRAEAGAAVRKLADQLRDPDPDARPASAAEALAELEHDGAAPPGEPTQTFTIQPEPDPGRYATAPFTPTTGVRRRHRRGRMAALVAVAAALVAAVGVFALAGGGDDGGGGRSPARADANGGGANGGQSKPDADAGAPAPAASSDGGGSASDAAAPPPTGDGAAGALADGASLNDQGYAMVSDGSFDEAIPVLERAVSALRDSGGEATYNYALYNLATAYLGAGRAEDAIPLLEERMSYDDGQLGEVQATLDRAYAEAGVKPPGGPEAGSPKDGAKPGKGPKGGAVPPPFQDEEGSD